ncbi:MAG: hypothetical protein V4484_09525 [Pseudomonadota bacterium]
MTHITLALPFALPPAELAPDLVRALQAPALAALLTRATCKTLPFDDNLRVLPHEVWLATKLGLSPSGHPVFGTAAMRGFELETEGDSWFIINPAHVDIARSHLSISDMRRLQLSEAHARALFDTAKPLFDELGKTLLYGDAQTWFMRAGDWKTMQTASPDAAVGMNLTDWLPLGAPATEFRKLQNEVQMLWFEHPANVERESAGLQAVNSFWPWAMAGASEAFAFSATLSTIGAPGWLAAIARPFGHKPGDTTIVHAELCESALSGDWATWLGHMQRLEETVFAPTLAALMRSQHASVKLVFSHRNAHKEFTSTKMAQYAFWREPSLDLLLP